MTRADRTIYEGIRDAKVSRDCEDAAKQFCQLAAPHCLASSTLAHPLLRLCLRPVYHLGYTQPEEALHWLHSNLVGTELEDFCLWLVDHRYLIANCLRELSCCDRAESREELLTLLQNLDLSQEEMERVLGEQSLSS